MVVHQCPCGALACRRRPRGARPRSRVRLVFAPDSSRKTSRVGSKPPCRRRQARRARAISGRSCSLARSVFFYISAPSSGARSDGGQGANQSQGAAQLGQGQIGLSLQERAQLAAMLCHDQGLRGQRSDVAPPDRRCAAVVAEAFSPSQARHRSAPPLLRGCLPRRRRRP